METPNARKESRGKYQNQIQSTNKHRENLKLPISPIKSPSPPPLPSPSNYDKGHKSMIDKGKQIPRSGRTSFSKAKESGKVDQNNKIMRKISTNNENNPPKQRKSKISLPYDDKFCCDDDNFYLIEKNCGKEKVI